MKFGIKSKLIISLILTNGLLAGMMYWVTSTSFDRGFTEYLAQTEISRLTPFLNALAKEYQQSGDWQWINTERYRWKQLIDKHLLLKKRPKNTLASPNFRTQQYDRRPPPPHHRGEHRPHREPPALPFSFDHRILLRDQQHNLIIGRKRSTDQAIWLPIVLNKETIGEIGIIKRTKFTKKLDRFFVDQQKQNFAFIAIAMLFIAISLALLLANHFLKPLNGIRTTLNQLVAGNYHQELPQNRSDELGQVAKDINLLSLTLKENLQARQQWIADISHELRTPVAILKGELEAMIDGIREIDLKAITSLRQETNRLSKLINDLHELSLTDLGALNYQKETLDINELLNDFIENNQDRIISEGLTLDFKPYPTKLNVFADGDRLDQLFKNLLQNTLRYTDVPGKLSIGIFPGTSFIEITWEDSSPSVRQEDLPQVFDRLFRAERSRNRSKGGTGLGLAICRNIVEAHNGNISSFQSPLGGLGIKIHLPL